MNELAPLTPTNMDEAIRLATAMANAKMVPKHLQGDVGTCLMIVEQAMRWRMSPFAVAQCTSNIGGKLMYEGKVTAAAVESQGAIEGHFDYDLLGEGDDRQVTVSARRRGEARDRQLTIKLRDVRTNNEHWKKQPDQMLCYSGVRNWARRFTPSALLGVYSPEEFNRDGKPLDTFDGPTIEADPPAPDERDRINAEIPMRAAAAVIPRQHKVAAYDDADPLEETDPRKWLANLETLLTNAGSQDEVVAIGGHRTVGNATAKAPQWIKNRVAELLATGYGRFQPTEPAEEPELFADAIPGEEKLGAG